MSEQPSEGERAGPAAALRLAMTLHRQGEVRQAQALYLDVLRAQPNNPDALHLLGVLATQSGKPQAAVELIGRAIAIDPHQATFHSNHGHALMAIDRHEEAVDCFDRALGLRPGYATALLNRGICLIHLGRFIPALDSLTRSLRAAPDNPDARVNRGVALAKLGRHAEALAEFERALDLRPDHVEAAFSRATALQQLARTTEAVAAFDRVIALRPGHVEALSGRGLALMRLQRYEESLANFDAALAHAPLSAPLHNDRGLVLQRLRRFDESLQSFERALSLQPDFVKALNNRGWILRQLGRPIEAAASLEQALALEPDFVEALTNHGAVLADLERLDEALLRFTAALKIDPDFQDALGNCGAVLAKQSRYPQAIECFGRLLALAPDAEYALGNLFNARQRCCDWADYRASVAGIAAALEGGRAVIDPFCHLSVADDPARQLECARMFADRHMFRADSAPPPAHRADGRIRLAYVSGEFREHAVSYLAAGLFEAHDRERFEVIGVSLRPAQDTAMGRRVKGAFDRFLDVRAWGDRQIVSRLRELEVDIAIDLAGWTGANRTGVFVQRAAPVQVNYLGFPGSMGLSCMDYIIADEFVIPPQSRLHYSEQVVYLPHSFQVNDAARKISDMPMTRSDCGLPDEGCVFCSFNNSYKINPPFFDIWARLLAAVPGSVLWLLGDNELARNNLQDSAAKRGISPGRLVFARRMPYEEHLRRLGLADLFLDSLPFNAGTTASDALWAGVPVLTCPGAGFAARMSGSLLRAMGLPELIAPNLAAYETLALRLALEPEKLASLREKLAVLRSSSPLFDTARFCRDLESAYRIMWERQQRGEPPASFKIEPQSM